MSIERLDRYTILVDGHRVYADKQLEQLIRGMTDEQRRAFLHIMGKERDQ